MRAMWDKAVYRWAIAVILIASLSLGLTIGLLTGWGHTLEARSSASSGFVSSDAMNPYSIGHWPFGPLSGLHPASVYSGHNGEGPHTGLHREGHSSSAPQDPRRLLGLTVARVAVSSSVPSSIPLPSRLVVTSVGWNGPADRAGIAVGDIVEQIDGQPVHSLDQMAEHLQSKQELLAKMTVIHGGREKVVMLTHRNP